MAIIAGQYLINICIYMLINFKRVIVWNPKGIRDFLKLTRNIWRPLKMLNLTEYEILKDLKSIRQIF